MDNKEVNNVIKGIKDIDNNVTGVLVPILKDTVADYRRIVFRLIIVIVLLIAGLIGTGVTAQVIISKQIEKYNDFLSQFDYESDEYTYEQDTTATDGDSIVNSGINVNY